VLGMGLVSITTVAELGLLPLSADVERQIHAMVHTSSHAPVPSEPTANSALSASGNTTAGTMTYSSSMGLTFDFGVNTWTARVNKG
jgi:hypothetical protein